MDIEQINKALPDKYTAEYVDTPDGRALKISFKLELDGFLYEPRITPKDIHDAVTQTEMYMVHLTPIKEIIKRRGFIYYLDIMREASKHGDDVRKVIFDMVEDFVVKHRRQPDSEKKSKEVADGQARVEAAAGAQRQGANENAGGKSFGDPGNQ